MVSRILMALRSTSSLFLWARIGREDDESVVDATADESEVVDRGTIGDVMKQQPSEIEEVVELTPEEIAELDDRAEAVERGEYVDGDEVLRRLRTGYYAKTDR
jgi:hypothetical protein